MEILLIVLCNAALFVLFLWSVGAFEKPVKREVSEPMPPTKSEEDHNAEMWASALAANDRWEAEHK